MEASKLLVLGWLKQELWCVTTGFQIYILLGVTEHRETDALRLAARYEHSLSESASEAIRIQLSAEMPR